MTHFLFASIITVIMVMNVAQGLNQINFIMVHLKREFAKETEHTLNQNINKNKHWYTDI